MKIVDGADGGTGLIGGDATNGLDVDVTRVSGTVTVAGAVTNAGTFAVQESGGALTALQLIDDAIVADNAAFTDGTTKVGLAGFVFDEAAGTALTENDAAAARVDAKRAQVGVLEDATTRGQRASVTSRGALFAEGPTAADAAIAAAPVTVGGRASTVVPTAMSADGDVVNAWLDRNGRLVVINDTGRAKTLKFASVSTASSGDTSLVSAVASNKIKVISYVLVASGTVSVRWYSGAAGTALSGAMALVANTGVSAIGSAESWLFETAVNTALVLNLSAAVQVSGHLSYIEEA